MVCRAWLFHLAAQINDDVINFLIGKIGHGGWPLEAAHAGVGATIFDGLAQKAIRDLVQKALEANGGAGLDSHKQVFARFGFENSKILNLPV